VKTAQFARSYLYSSETIRMIKKIRWKKHIARRGTKKMYAKI